MAAPDSGVTWNEAKPDNDTLANEIDDFQRHLQTAIRSRLALEHIWPDAHTGTGSAGRHTFITFQPQAAAPTLAGTTAGALYVSTAPFSLIFEASKAGTALCTIVDTSGVLQLATGGTQGSIVIASSANTGGGVFLTGSANGLVLITHAATAVPSWGTVASVAFDPTLIAVSNALNYVAASATGVAVNRKDIKVAFGALSIGANAAKTVDGLPFTDLTSYGVSVCYQTGDAINAAPACATQIDGAKCSIVNDHGATQSVIWMMIGT